MFKIKFDTAASSLRDKVYERREEISQCRRVDGHLRDCGTIYKEPKF